MAHYGNFAASFAALLFATLGAFAPVPIAAATNGTDTANVTWSTSSQTIGTTTNLTLSVTLSSTTAGVTTIPTGFVNFYDTTTNVAVGTTAVSNGVASVALASGSLPAGPHLIEALYSGDSLFASVTSTTITITVESTVSVVLTSNTSTASTDQVVLLTATVTPALAASGEANPTGQVVFYSGATAIGSATLSPATGNSSVAILTISTLPAANDSITAVYQGDSYYVTATSSALSVNVQDFSITPASTNPATNLNIVQGSSGSAAFVVTGLGGYNSQVQVVCSVPAQDYMTCTATPQQITPTGTVIFTVATFTTGGVTALNRKQPPLWSRVVGGTALSILGLWLLPSGTRFRLYAAGEGRRSVGRFLVLLLLMVGLTGAVGGCNSSNISSGGGTPLGVATLTITASANVDNAVVSHSVYLTVNVTP